MKTFKILEWPINGHAGCELTVCSDDEEEQTIIEQANLIVNGNRH